MSKRSKSHPRNCKQCGEQFYARERNEGVFCSNKCHGLARTEAKPPRQTYTCTWCNEQEVSRKGGYCSNDCRKAKARDYSNTRASASASPKSPRNCIECDLEFVPAYGDKHRSFCSDDCAHRKRSRISTAAKDARKRGAKVVVYFDPLPILEQYGWRCYLCDVPTPKELRGTNDNRAPQLDHVISIAKGGAHSPNNVACACLACNRKKGDQDLNEFIAAAA